MKLLATIEQQLRVLGRQFPKRVKCNICGWSGRCFNGDRWHPYTICWQCGSLVRHRLVVATLQNIDGLKYADIVDGKRILHFAPEEATTQLFKPRASQYRTADFDRADVDEKLDITNMPSIATGSFDLVIAADVLEHVGDHMQGMREIRRVLAPGGYAILTVPQQDNLQKTWGDPNLTDPIEREKAFGQWDHVRIFGLDMKELLESVGFEVRVITADDFPKEMVRKNALFPPVLSKHPLATNYRHIYFAKNPK